MAHQIRKNVEAFVGGRLQRVDLDGEGRIISGGKGAAPAAPASPSPAAPGGKPDPLKKADELKGPTKQELMTALKEKGIPFKATLSSAALAELLKAGTPAAPASEPTGAEAPAGVGDQDVI